MAELGEYDMFAWIQNDLVDEHAFGQKVERVRIGQKGLCALAECSAREYSQDSLLTAWAVKDVLYRRHITAVIDRYDGREVPLLIDPNSTHVYELDVVADAAS